MASRKSAEEVSSTSMRFQKTFKVAAKVGERLRLGDDYESDASDCSTSTDESQDNETKAIARVDTSDEEENAVAWMEARGEDEQMNEDGDDVSAKAENDDATPMELDNDETITSGQHASAPRQSKSKSEKDMATKVIKDPRYGMNAQRTNQRFIKIINKIERSRGYDAVEPAVAVAEEMTFNTSRAIVPQKRPNPTAQDEGQSDTRR